MVDVTTARASMVPGAGPAASRREEPVGASFREDTDLVNIISSDVPNEVRPSHSIPVSFRVKNDAITATFDPDTCLTGPVSTGFRIEGVVDVDGVEMHRERFCLGIQGNIVEFRAENVRAPATQGDITVSIRVVGANSGHVADRVEHTVTVTEAAEPEPCPTGFERDPATGQCVPKEPGGGGLFPTGDLGGAANQLIVLAVLLLVISTVAGG